MCCRATFPEKSLVLSSPDARHLGVLDPNGAGIVLDLVERREILRFQIERSYRDKLKRGFLMCDRTQIYLLCDEKREAADTKMVNGPFDDFAWSLGATKVFNGRIYAFDRATGALAWFKAMPNQGLLVSRFEELPVILCSAVCYVQMSAGNNPRMICRIRTLDKHTGKICLSRETAPTTNPIICSSSTHRPGASISSMPIRRSITFPSLDETSSIRQ